MYEAQGSGISSARNALDPSYGTRCCSRVRPALLSGPAKSEGEHKRASDFPGPTSRVESGRARHVP